MKNTDYIVLIVIITSAASARLEIFIKNNETQLCNETSHVANNLVTRITRLQTPTECSLQCILGGKCEAFSYDEGTSTCMLYNTTRCSDKIQISLFNKIPDTQKMRKTEIRYSIYHRFETFPSATPRACTGDNSRLAELKTAADIENQIATGVVWFTRHSSRMAWIGFRFDKNSQKLSWLDGTQLNMF